MLAQLKDLPQNMKALFGGLAAVAVVALIGNIYQSNTHGTAAEAWDQERIQLSESIAGLESDKTGLEGDKTALQAQVADLEAANADLTKVHGSLAALQAEAAASKDKLAGITGLIGQNESHLKVVGLRLATSQSSLMAAVKKREQAAKAAAELQVNAVRLVNLREEVYSHERQLQQFGQRLAIARLSLRKAMDRRQKVVDEAKAAELERGTLGRLIAEVDVSDRQLKSLSQRLASSRVGLDGTLKRKRQAEERLGELQTQSNWLASVVAETTTKERRLEQISQRLATSQGSLERASAQRQLVVDQTEALEAKLAGVERKLMPLQRALESWTIQAKDMRNLVDEAKGALGGPLVF